MKPINKNLFIWNVFVFLAMIASCESEQDENEHLIPVIKQPLTKRKFKTASEAFDAVNKIELHAQLVSFGHDSLKVFEVEQMLDMFKQIAGIAQALEPETPKSLAESKDWEQVLLYSDSAVQFLEKAIGEVQTKVVIKLPKESALNCSERDYVRQALLCFYTYTDICVESKKRLYCLLPENIASLAACTLTSCE